MTRLTFSVHASTAILQCQFFTLIPANRLSFDCLTGRTRNSTHLISRAYEGERIIFRYLMPADKPRNISFALHGHQWKAQPDDPFSRFIPVQGAVSIGGNYLIEPKNWAAAPGDYLYRSVSLRWDVESGPLQPPHTISLYSETFTCKMMHRFDLKSRKKAVHLIF